MTGHTKKWKQTQLAELKRLINEYPIVAVADISKFPSDLFAQIRKKLTMQGSVVKVSKTKIIKKALSESEHTKKLVDYAKSNCALIFTKTNPFELYGFVKKNKGKIAAKTGAVAEEDITIPAGDTGLPPGPALSDLKGAGLKVAVQGASIAIMEDKVVTKVGEKVTGPVAATLSKLGIKPFKIGMKLSAVLEHNQVFEAKVLDIDLDQVFANFVDAHRKAFNLAINAAITNAKTIEVLLAKAFNDTKAVAVKGNVVTKETAGIVLGKADRAAKALGALVKTGDKA